jgi:hypothetical protein
MGQRLELHSKLLDITPNVYFQPPSNVQMEYPCIVYQREFGDTKFASDLPYRHTRRYTVTIISRNPDNEEIYDKVAALPMCTYNRFYVAETLNHDVFYLFF